MKKLWFISILVLVIMVSIVPNYSYALTRKGLKDPSKQDVNLDPAKDWASVSGAIDPAKTQDVFQTISGVLLYGAIAVAVIWGALLGAKFVVGTVETKATVKDNLVPYFIGLVVAFGAYGIWSAVINILR